jgi:hypothetical protein
MTVAARVRVPFKSWLGLFVIAAVLSALWVGAQLADINNVMVHPHSPTDHMSRLLTTLSPALRDLIAPFQEYDHRARFLTYFTLLVDFRIRMFLYEYVPVFPTFSITWLLTGLLGPYLLYRCCRNLGSPIYVALSAVLVYVTSIGVLSGFFMFLMAGKPLSSVLFLAMCEYATRSHRDGTSRPGRLGYLYLWTLVLMGCFLDELFFAAIIVYPMLYWIARGKIPATRSAVQADIRRAVTTFGPPLAIFVVLMLLVLPILTSHFWGYRLDYMGVVHNRLEIPGATARYDFNPANLGPLAYTLFGVSLIPRQIAEFVAIPGSGVKTAQSVTLLGLLVLASWMFVVARQFARMDIRQRSRLALMAATALLMILLIALMQARHVPIITGYYYGCIFSAVFALGFALAAAPAGVDGTRPRPWTVTAVAAAIALIQLNNFFEINRAFVDYHNVHRDYYETARFEDIQKHPFTWHELRDIHTAWKEKRLPEFLSQHTVSDAAWYELMEFRHIDHLKGMR